MTSAILYRYILRECVRTWSAVAAVLLVLTLGVGFARFIARAAAGEMPADIVFTVAGYSALENLEIVLPVSLLLAILLTVGRLCRDNEMAAMAAGGAGLAQLYRPFLTFALLLAAVAAWLSLSLGPEAGRAMQRLEGAAGAMVLGTLEPGRFHTLLDGRAVFYAEAVTDGGRRMRDVFIRVRGSSDAAGQPAPETVVVADRAWQREAEGDGGRTLVLRDGRRYEGMPGRADYRVIRFAEHGVRVAPPAPELDLEPEERDTSELLGRGGPAARAELQRRLAVPISVLVLALVAVPLGQVPPRSGRYGRLVIGILLYVGYANLLRLAELWLARGVTPPALGLWWVHGLVLAVVPALLAYRSGHLRLRMSSP